MNIQGVAVPYTREEPLFTQSEALEGAAGEGFFTCTRGSMGCVNATPSLARGGLRTPCVFTSQRGGTPSGWPAIGSGMREHNPLEGPGAALEPLFTQSEARLSIHIPANP